MRRIVLFVIPALIILTGCGGPYYFDLSLDPDSGEPWVKIDKVLFIKDIDSSEAFSSQRMVFRSKPYQVEYFTFRQWAERPEELIKNRVVFFYRNSSVFKRVVGEYSSIEADILLKMNIYSLEMVKYKKEWYAHLALDLEFINKTTEKVILLHSFDRKMKMRGKKVRYFPEKISLILKEELIKAASGLSRAM